MNIFFGIIFAAIVVEGIITYVNQFVVDKKFQWQMLVGLVLGVLVAVVYNLDLFELVGMTAAVPFVGCVLTGIVISRGSNYVYDLIDLIAGIIKRLETSKSN